MIEIIQSETFKQWLIGLKDRSAAMRVYVRLDRAACGNLGDVRPVREGILEMRIDHGPGYRLYFMRRGSMLIILLVGGDKHSQDADITSAIKLAKEWKE